MEENIEKCTICGSDLKYLFTGKVLNKYDVNYFICPCCGLLQTEKPYWKEQAYKSSITGGDIGLIQRNLSLMKLTKSIINFGFNKKGHFLDFAGGYGLFTRLMRDYGYDFYLQDLYTENLFAKGFNYSNEKIELITAFEVFEHFDNPINEFENLLKISHNILISTNLYPKPIPDLDSWWYYSPYHGQHISFYSLQTFKYLAKKYNLYFYSNKKNIHLFSEKKLPKIYLNYLFFMNKLDEYFSITKKHINNDLKILLKS